MTDLPKSIRIGYLDYAVEEWKPSLATAADRLAECDRVNSIIRVRLDIPRQRIAECLLHEALHAAYDVGCISGDDEEKIVSIFGNQLTQIWRDNPDLIAFMEGTFR